MSGTGPLEPIGPSGWSLGQWAAVAGYLAGFAALVWLLFRIARPFEEEFPGEPPREPPAPENPADDAAPREGSPPAP